MSAPSYACRVCGVRALDRGELAARARICAACFEARMRRLAARLPVLRIKAVRP